MTATESRKDTLGKGTALSNLSSVLFYGTKPFLLVVHTCWEGRIRKAFHIILFVFSLNDVIDME